MPARTTGADSPEMIRPYVFHGVNLETRSGSIESIGDCPLCGKEGKFSVNTTTGLWRCLYCNEGADKGKVYQGGNVKTFLRMFHTRCEDATTSAEHEELANDRKLLDPNTPMLWGCAKSFLTGEWLVPGYDHEGRLCQLYRYVSHPVSGKLILLATPDQGHGTFRPVGYNTNKPTVYVAEGPWDGMALWELMRGTKAMDSGLTPTSNEAVSLLHEANVLAVPGCNSFSDKWLPLFNGKSVALLFDNDHPYPHPKTGKLIEGAGPAGTKRVARLLLQAAEPPSSVGYLKWGEGQGDAGMNGFCPDKPSGYDVRDALADLGDSLKDRVAGLEEILAKVEPVPDDWVPGRTAAAKEKGGAEIECLPCYSWKTLVNAWRKAMKWTEGLDRALTVILSSVISTKAVGDQLWVKLIGPPSCGKSVLCEAVSVNRRYVYPKDTLTGLTSGYQVDRKGSENMSLAPKLKDKTLVINDGDTLLQMPNLAQILSQFRAFYGRNLRTQYGNMMSGNHEAINATVVLSGTESLRALDTSELGERFLDVVVVDEMDLGLEREIGWRVALRAMREVAYVSNGKAETAEGPEMIEAKRLTGGYVDYLRGNAQELLMKVEASESDIRKCQLLAEFVSFMRARPSKRQEEKAQRELSFRLISQHVRLAICLAAVMNRTTLDAEVMERVRRVALDTARGRTLNIAKHMAEAGTVGLTMGALSLLTGETEAKERDIISFLRKIKAVESYVPTEAGVRGKRRYRLTKRLQGLYEVVVGNKVVEMEETV